LCVFDHPSLLSSVKGQDLKKDPDPYAQLSRTLLGFLTTLARHTLVDFDLLAGLADDQMADVVVPVQTPARGPHTPAGVDEGDSDQVLAGNFTAVDLVVGAGAVLNLAAVMNGVEAAACAAGDDVGVALDVRDPCTARQPKLIAPLESAGDLLWEDRPHGFGVLDRALTLVGLGDPVLFGGLL